MISTRYAWIPYLFVVAVLLLVNNSCTGNIKSSGHLHQLDSITELMQITSSKSNEFFPRISNKGDRMFFVADKADNLDIFVSDLFCKNPMHVTFSSSNEVQPCWSPDDKAIYFTSDRLGYSAIFRKKLADERITREITVRGTPDSSPAINKDNGFLAFSNFNSSIWLQDMQDFTNVYQIAEGSSPQWKPNERTLLFSSRKSGNSDIWLTDVHASYLTQITVDSADDIEPSWSPDGKKIVFASNRTGNFDLWLLDLANDQLVQLTNNLADDHNPAWTPDGEYIYFDSIRSNNLDIWRIKPVISGK
jgi:Tol biopolymer transport system component